MTFQRATKQACTAKVALFGPSGAGKTFSALRIAEGLAGGKPIALIDTEYGRAAKYGDRFSFDTVSLGDQSVTGYIEMMGVAAKAGYAVLIIDSLSHAWKDLVQEVDKLANAKYGGNSWRAWSEGTPLQQKMVRALLTFPGHIIATMRSKTDWVVESRDGKSIPRRVGLTPEQGKGIEYEFDFLIELSQEHLGHVIKDVSGKFQDSVLDPPDEHFGKKLGEWVGSGTSPQTTHPKEKPALSHHDLAEAILVASERHGVDLSDVLKRAEAKTIHELSMEQLEKTADWMAKKTAPQEAPA